MSEPVKELQQYLFGGIHDFHAERTATWIDAVCQKLGNEVLDVISKKGVDTYGLYRWHIERTLLWIDALTNEYGSTIVDIIVNKHRTERYEQGSKLAEELGKNSLEDIIPFFSYGNNENIIEKDNKQVFIKATGCLAGKIACDIDRSEMIYALHCNLDKDFVEGFNSNLGCEIIQTLINGHDCCIHRIYVKEQ